MVIIDLEASVPQFPTTFKTAKGTDPLKRITTVMFSGVHQHQVFVGWRKQKGVYRWHYVMERHAQVRARGRYRTVVTRIYKCGQKIVGKGHIQDLPEKADVCPLCRAALTAEVVESD